MPALSSILPKLIASAFTPLDPGELRDGELRLVLREVTPAMSGRVPTYRFEMIRLPEGKEIGAVDLRVGNTHDVVTYAGHVGYRVYEEFRGHRYAARSTQLLYDLARRHGIRDLWITCDPDNAPSRRTCELLGGELVSTVPVPKSHAYYKTGSRAKCRFLVKL